MGFLIFIVLLFVLLWLMVFLPQRRRQAAQKALLGGLKPGDEVLTAGGLYGDVTEIGEDEVALEIAPGVEVRVATRAIATVIPPDAYEDDEPGDAEEADEEPGDADERDEGDEEPAELEPASESADGTAEAEQSSTEADRR